MAVAGKRTSTMKREPLTRKPGVVYKPSRDRLYIFDRRAVVVISGGPVPQAWRKTIERGWRAARPAIPQSCIELSLSEAEESPVWHLKDGLRAKNGQFLFPFMEQVRDACFGDRAWVAWLRGLDVEHRRAVAPFRERAWHLLMLALRCPGATDLMHSSPALAFALASSWVFRGERRVRWPLRSARALVRKRQRVIADWLGFPATESAVRMLRRVPHHAVDIGPLLYLRGAMHEEAAGRLLRHVPAITADVIRIVTTDNLRRHASPRLLIEAGSELGPEVMPVRRTMQDTLVMLAQMKREPAGLIFRSRDHLVMVHDEVAAALTGGRSSWRDAHLRIPRPPLEGTDAIIPLTKVADYFEEGREQQSCVASYASRVAVSVDGSRDGRASLYVYRVLQPERATLAIRRDRGAWCIDELRCAQNRPAAHRTQMAVQEWLDGHNMATWPYDHSSPTPEWNEPLPAHCEEECLVPF